jgi:dephospho-CoA kinase
MLLGLTGGLATGKSTLSRFLQELQEFVVFDADNCVHELLSSDPRIISAVRGEFALAENLPVDRAVLRELVFSDPDRRRRLEAILHPAVRAKWEAMAATCRVNGKQFLAEIPLLFETGANAFFDTTIAVASSAATQRARLAARGLGPSMVDAMLASQWSVGQKVTSADHVIWNDGSLAELRRQASLLLQHILPRAA